MKTDCIMRKELEKVLDLLTPGNRLVMLVCVSTGLRVGDVLALRREKIARQFWIAEQKTGKKRRVNLSEELVDTILAMSRGSVWAFPGRDPRKPRRRQTVWKDVKRAQRAFRLSVNLGTHTARKAFAVALMERYGSLGRVQRALNHKDAEVTVLYAMADELTRRKLEARQLKAARRRRSAS